MEQLITTVACLLCAGFGMAAVLTIQSMATTPTKQAPTPQGQGQEQAPATDDRQSEQQTRSPREIATQWENLLNYTGGSRGVDHE